MLNEIFESKYAGWLILGVLFLVLNVAIVGMNHWGFHYGNVYAVCFFAFAFLAYVKKPSIIATGIVSSMSLFMVLTSIGYINPYPALMAVGGLFVAAIVIQFIYNPQTALAKYLAPTPLGLILAYYITGLIINFSRDTNAMASGLTWSFTRLGITILAVDGLLKVAGIGEGRKGKTLRLLMPIGLLLAFLGAIYQVVGVPNGALNLFSF